MPYAMPASPEAVSPELPPLKLRPKHRRTRSATAAFSEERGPGAFTSLPHLPRRRGQDKKPMFHFNNDQDSDSSDESPQRNSLGLSIDTVNIPSNLPPTPPANELSTLPFPSKGSPIPSPTPPSPPPLANRHEHSKSSGSLPRTPSTPVILSNGKPLKPSLKSSQSSPHIPGLPAHQRAQSEPSTPLVKNVHFPETEAIKSVRVFDKTGKPANLSRAPGEETETETEYDSSAASGTNLFSRPPVHASTPDLPFEVDAKRSSSIPSPDAPTYSNVHLETVTLPRSSPPMLRGSVLVRNIAFTKEVTVRFTLDDWQTTSEVACRYVSSLPSLPPPFRTPSTVGDRAATLGTGASEMAGGWDRFNFVIRLEDFERKLGEKTLWMVVKYTVPGQGEWWDNNEHKNYRVSFTRVSSNLSTSTIGPASAAGAKAQISAPSGPSPSQSISRSQQGTFSPPPTVKLTAPTQPPPTQAYSQRPPIRPSPMVRSQSMPQTGSAAMASQYLKSNRSSLPSKLNLLNYAAPSSFSSTRPNVASPPYSQFVEEDESVRDGARSPPRRHTRKPLQMQMPIIGGQPTSDFFANMTFPLTASPSSSSSSLSSQNTPPASPPPQYTPLHQTAMSPEEDPLPETPTMADLIEKAQQSTFRRDSPPITSPATDSSSYAALLKQWCFVQSPTPSPSLPLPVPAGKNAPGNGNLMRNGHGNLSTSIPMSSPPIASLPVPSPPLSSTSGSGASTPKAFQPLPPLRNGHDNPWLGLGMDSFGIRSDSPLLST